MKSTQRSLFSEDHLLNNIIFIISHKLLKLGKRRDQFNEAYDLSVRFSRGTAFMWSALLLCTDSSLNGQSQSAGIG